MYASATRNQDVPTGIILRIKREKHSAVSRHMERSVVCGHFQNYFYDHTELYGPVGSIDLVRPMFSLAVRLSYEVNQVNVRGAFIHDELPESDENYVLLPNIDGLPTGNGQLVNFCKCLDGLRQSPRLWYRHLDNTLRGTVFRRSQNSESIFIGVR